MCNIRLYEIYMDIEKLDPERNYSYGIQKFFRHSDTTNCCSGGYLVSLLLNLNVKVARILFSSSNYLRSGGLCSK